jgi:hypothetical protein
MIKYNRIHVPIDHAHLYTIGLELYNFDRLEWDAVYRVQRIG